MGRRKLGRVHAQLVQRRLGRVSHGVVSVFFFSKNPFSMLSSSFMRPDFTPVESSRSSDKELRVQPRSYLKTYGERAFSFIAPKPTMEYPPIKYKTFQGSGIF